MKNIVEDPYLKEIDRKLEEKYSTQQFKYENETLFQDNLRLQQENLKLKKIIKDNENNYKKTIIHLHNDLENDEWQNKKGLLDEIKYMNEKIHIKDELIKSLLFINNKLRYPNKISTNQNEIELSYSDETYSESDINSLSYSEDELL